MMWMGKRVLVDSNQQVQLKQHGGGVYMIVSVTDRPWACSFAPAAVIAAAWMIVRPCVQNMPAVTSKQHVHILLT